MDWNNFFIALLGLLGAGGPLMWFLRALDKRNTRQHQDAVRGREEISETIKTAVSKVETKVDTALEVTKELHEELKEQRQLLTEHLVFHAHKPVKEVHIQ